MLHAACRPSDCMLRKLLLPLCRIEVLAGAMPCGCESWPRSETQHSCPGGLQLFGPAASPAAGAPSEQNGHASGNDSSSTHST